MATARSIALNYLDRFADDIRDCLYSIDEGREPEIYFGVVEEIEVIETTIKMIKELEVE